MAVMSENSIVKLLSSPPPLGGCGGVKASALHAGVFGPVVEMAYTPHSKCGALLGMRVRHPPGPLPTIVGFIYPKGSPIMELITIVLDTLVAVVKALGSGLDGLWDLGVSALSSAPVADVPEVPEVPETPAAE